MLCTSIRIVKTSTFCYYTYTAARWLPGLSKERTTDRSTQVMTSFHLKEHYLSYQTTVFCCCILFCFLKKDIFVFIFHLISTYLLFRVSPADSHLFRDPSLNPLNAHPQSASWWADREEQGDSLRVCYNKFKSTDLCFRLRRQGELFPSRSS